jgi:hypothetical protein
MDNISDILEGGATSWNNLKILHMTIGSCHAEDLLPFLLRYQTTLEEVSFTEMLVIETKGVTCISIFVALKTFPKLNRLTFNNLAFSNHGVNGP